MHPDLLERDQFFQSLVESFHRAATERGQIALISGEAGIGKTSLVERFAKNCPLGTRILWGTCEDLFTPRPLGPLYDMVHQFRTPLRAALENQSHRAMLFTAFMDELTSSASPTVVILEDLHWADEATLDLVKFLSRRIHHTTVLLIVIYRHEELSRDHPLRLVLGDLPTRGVTQLRLPPLSEAAVATLAQQADRPTTDLYRITGGNPFFLSEVLATDSPGVPISISDAVLAQIARRSPEAQRLLELVSVVPQKVAWESILEVSERYGAVLEECLAVGILHLEERTVGFRHELARQAVESALTPDRRRGLHAKILQVLIRHEVEQSSLARLVHHAVQSEDTALIVRFAPAAAQQASAQGAHREATAHYVTSLRYAHRFDAEQQAELLDGLSQEHYLTGHFKDAIQPCEAALALWRKLGCSMQAGHCLRRLSRISWFLNRNTEAEHHGMAAVELLESLPPSRELAMAYANLSHLRMLEGNSSQTVLWGERAIELAERLHDSETLSYALNNVGSAQLDDGNENGYAPLVRSLHLALEHGYEEHVARAYANIATYKSASRDYAQAADYLQKGIAYCAERDLGSYEHCLRGTQARARLEQGDWAGAGEDVTSILNTPWATGSNRTPALIVLGHLRTRRGDPGASAVLDEMRGLALANGEIESMLSVAAVQAEWRWLQGDWELCVVEAESSLQLALQQTYPWYVGELAIWLWRAGGLHTIPTGVSAPFALQMAGDWQAAADIWKQMSCPYEQAMALMDGNEVAQREALAIFEHLGAVPAAKIVRRNLQRAGVRGLPRGPHAATQANPWGLTNRQLEILFLLAEGLHNAEIADRLSTTLKTVEHHVTGIITKMDVRSRTEAVRTAYQLGLLPQMEQK